VKNSQPILDDQHLQPVLGKVLAGERLSFDDGVLLYRSPDLLTVGWMANYVRERLHGNRTYFNVNRHINPTDVCVASCRLCAFGKHTKDPSAYTMSLEEVWERAGHGYSEAVTEFHIVGGLHPELTLDWYCQMIRGLKERYPQVHLKAFTMVEVAYLAKRTKISIGETLERLKAAGVDSLPGGGAEIFSERVRRIICDHKIDGDEWIGTARAAHRIGLKSNCTMLYGHLETEADRVDHLVRLRELQDETQGFVTFIPLAFHPKNTALSHLATTSGFDDLRQIAVSRLMLDNIPHIKAYWIMMTPGVAQIAQRFGANDIDGTVVEEKIYHDAGATTSQHLRRQDLLRLIQEAGREPLERDTAYRPVVREESTFTVLV
jgi:aminodeoxyfutalosine synthase